MLLASDRAAEISSCQDGQGLADLGGDAIGEHLDADGILEPAGGLQIDLGRPGSQHCFPAENDPPSTTNERYSGYTGPPTVRPPWS